LDDLSLVEALKGRIGDMRARLARLEQRVAKKREIATTAMERAEIKKITEPDFTASFSISGPKVSVTSEEMIPGQYWKAQTPKLDRVTLAAMLKAGQAVPGAVLTNGSPFVSVRTK
jgi:CxxC motif-containing protein